MTKRPETPKLSIRTPGGQGQKASVPPSPRRSTGDAAAILHDSDLLGQDWARVGFEQLRRGETIPLDKL